MHKSFLLTLLFPLQILPGMAQSAIRMVVGTYTDGTSRGIYSFVFDQVKGIAHALDTLDISNPSFLTISQNGSRIYAVSENSDSTELYAWVDEEASLTAQSVLSIDFDGASSAGTYSGTARVGYTGGVWTRLAVPDGAATVESRPLKDSGTGERTGAVLVLSKAGGIAATADGGAMDTEASALFRDGVASTGTSDVTTFTLKGLLPGTDYELYLYSRAKSGDAVVNGAFASGGAEAVSTEEWFADNGGDYAVLTVRSDASGVASGTFRSASDATAVWGGVQIVGPGYAGYVPEATLLFFR